MFWYLYTVKNTVNNKQYIGIATNVGRRWIEHKCGYGSKLLYQAFQKYGVEKFKFDIVAEGSKDEIAQLEMDLVAQRKTKAPMGYNLTAGGEGSTGWKPSKETRKKMSKAHTGKRNGMHGKKHNKETREKMRQKRLGKPNPIRSKLNKQLSRANNPRAKVVLVNNVEYQCMADAADNLRISASALRARFARYNKTGNWPSGWAYL